MRERDPGGTDLQWRARAARAADALGLETTAQREACALFAGALHAARMLDSPDLVVDQILWMTVRLPAVGAAVSPREVADAVGAAFAADAEPAEAERLSQLIGRAFALAEEAGPQRYDRPVELSERSRAYLDATLAADRTAALAVVTAALEDGQDVARVLLEILQPAQLEVGRLWHRGLASVAQEHFTSAVTQLAMSMLYLPLFESRAPARGKARTLVGAGVGIDAHEIGIRIVTDLAEAAGWRTVYLGAGVPAEDILDEAVRHHADVLALSCALARNVPALTEVIARARANPALAGVKIVVGGRPFQLSTGLAERVGADGWAEDASTALELLDRLAAADA